MTPTQFIEDAIKGGWSIWLRRRKDRNTLQDGARIEDDGIWYEYGENLLPIHEILLDPKSWEAVGKTREWFEGIQKEVIGVRKYREIHTKMWLFYMHRFIDHLADGKTIDESLSALA